MTKVATMYVNQAGAIKKFGVGRFVVKYGVHWSSDLFDFHGQMTQNEIWTMIPRALLTNLLLIDEESGDPCANAQSFPQAMFFQQLTERISLR